MHKPSRALGAVIAMTLLASSSLAVALGQSADIGVLLSGGGPVLGVFPGQQTAEGGAAVVENEQTDFVFYSMERGPFDIPAMQEYATAMRAAGPQRQWPLALRIPPIGENESAARERMQQAIEAGVAAIVVPHVTSRREAEVAVAGMGARGWPKHAGGDLVNMLIVEDKEGVANVRDIVGTPGVSVVFAGPGDLSRAYERDMEAVEDAIQTILSACLEFDVACGITAGAEDIARRLSQGFRVVIVTQNEALGAAREYQRRAEERERGIRELQAMDRPIGALDSIWIEELTFLEVRDAQRAGKTTAIVASGGIEQNGPYVATGKHNYVLAGICEGLARELGDSLCAPILKLVPEGGIDPPSGHMRYPGTISLREETFRAVLDDVASSLRATGFEHVVFIGDSGGNQGGMEAVAAALNERWGETRVHYIPEYYRMDEVIAYQENVLGITEVSEGYHDFYWLTAMMMTVDPETVRYDQRVAAGLASINGVPIAPLSASVEAGERLIRFRVQRTAEAIRNAIAAAGAEQQ